MLKKEFNILEVFKLISNNNIIQKSNKYWANCIFHQEKTPSMILNEQNNTFKCFGCNIYGNSIDLYSKFKNISKQETIQVLSNTFNINLNNLDMKYKKNYSIEQKYYIDLNNLVIDHLNDLLLKNKQVIEYLNKRNISIEDIHKYKIGFCPNDNNLWHNWIEQNKKLVLDFDYSIQDLLNNKLLNNSSGNLNNSISNRIIFPIFDEQNNVIALNCRSLDKNNKVKYLFLSNEIICSKKELLYNINNVDKNTEKIYLVEGVLDLISLSKIINNDNILCTLGVDLSWEKLNKLKDFKRLKNVVLSFDFDQAGTKARLDNYEKILNNKWIPKILDINQRNCIKDINEFAISKTCDSLLEKNFIDWYLQYSLKNNEDKLSVLSKATQINQKFKEIDSIVAKYNYETINKELFKLNFNFSKLNKVLEIINQDDSKYTRFYFEFNNLLEKYLNPIILKQNKEKDN